MQVLIGKLVIGRSIQFGKIHFVCFVSLKITFVGKQLARIQLLLLLLFRIRMYVTYVEKRCSGSWNTFIRNEA